MGFNFKPTYVDIGQFAFRTMGTSFQLNAGAAAPPFPMHLLYVMMMTRGNGTLRSGRFLFPITSPPPSATVRRPPARQCACPSACVRSFPQSLVPVPIRNNEEEEEEEWRIDEQKGNGQRDLARYGDACDLSSTF